jgi:hypothetical protein
VALLIAAAAFFGCSKEASFTADDLGVDVRLKSDTLTATASDWDILDRSAGNSWRSRRLVVANTEYTQCGSSVHLSRSFLRFGSLPDSAADITSATLYMYVTHVWPCLTSCGLTLDIHTLTDTLDQRNIYWGNMPAFDPGAIGGFFIPLHGADSVSTDITEVVRSWVSGESSNLGLAIVSDESPDFQSLVEFASREAPPVENISDEDTTTLDFRPALRIAYVDTAGEEQFFRSVASEDVFADTLMNFGDCDDPAMLVVGNGFPSRAFVKFDVMTLPIEATVSKAVLNLTVSNPASRFDSMGVICHAVLDSAWSGYGTTIGLTGAGLAILKRDEMAQEEVINLDITPLIQPLVARQQRNYGLVIKSVDETSDLDFVSFFSSSVSDTSLRPKLKLDYVMPPLPPYSEE